MRPWQKPLKEKAKVEETKEIKVSTERFGFEVQAVGLDAGYYTAGICRGLEERGIYGAMPYIRPAHRKGYLRKIDYGYDECYDCYLCPKDHVLSYRTTTRLGFREYVSDPEVCRNCELRDQCTQSANHIKVITRHVRQDYKDRVNEHRYEDRGKRIYARRKETVERSFADSKQLHGHWYARMRGLSKVKEQCLLAAACQNMKKIATIVTRKGRSFFFIAENAPEGISKRSENLQKGP